jgi:membrane protein
MGTRPRVSTGTPDKGKGGGLKQRFADLRARYGFLDHLLRAWAHYGDVRGNQLAGAVTYFGFLSFFPLLALAFAAVGQVVVVYPQAEDDVAKALIEALPGLVGSGPNQINLATFEDARAGAGIAGLLGLLYAGLGWIDGLREALRQVFLLPVRQGNIVKKKLADLLVLVLLGLGALASLAVSSLATAVTGQILGTVDLDESTLAKLGVRVLAPVLSIGVTTVLLLIIFTRLPGRGIPWREALQGAFFGAVGIQILMVLGTYLLAGTTGNKLYGIFAVVVGLLVWINFLSRVLLLSAAWTAADRNVAPMAAGADASPGPAPVEPETADDPESVREAQHAVARAAGYVEPGEDGKSGRSAGGGKRLGSGPSKARGRGSARLRPAAWAKAGVVALVVRRRRRAS